MKHLEFKTGIEFYSLHDGMPNGYKIWRCTDIGNRTIIAIDITGEDLDNHGNKIGNDKSWYNGPPYAVVEYVFDEYDIRACKLNVKELFDKMDKNDYLSMKQEAIERGIDFSEIIREKFAGKVIESVPANREEVQKLIAKMVIEDAEILKALKENYD